MNETIRLRMVNDGRPVAVNELSSAGIVVDGESSALPRGLALSLSPANSITEFRLRRVRQIQDWRNGEFKLNIGLDAGAIVCRGVDALSLPFGRYVLEARVSDWEPAYQPVDVDVPENDSVDIKLGFRADRRRIKLVTTVDDFDPAIRRVLEDPASQIDGLPASTWIAGTTSRPRRQACMLNLLAKLRTARGPRPKSWLIDSVRSFLFADVDRVYAATSSTLLTDLQTLSKDPSKPFYFEGSPKSATHQRLKEAIRPQEADASRFDLFSFRQEGKASMQIVVAVPPGGDPARTHYADLDIDLGNPLQDLEGLFIHFGELLSPNQTDHLKLAEKLSKGLTGEFLYYKVTKAASAKQ